MFIEKCVGVIIAGGDCGAYVAVVVMVGVGRDCGGVCSIVNVMVAIVVVAVVIVVVVVVIVVAIMDVVIVDVAIIVVVGGVIYITIFWCLVMIGIGIVLLIRMSTCARARARTLCIVMDTTCTVVESGGDSAIICTMTHRRRCQFTT